MKLISSLTSILMLAFGVLMIASCTEEELCATWDADIKTIVDNTCAYAGCHSGGSTANPFLSVESNDFTSYEAIKANLDNGTFEQRALIAKDMPNAMFVPAGNPTALTQDELEILQCWADAGYPES